MSYEPLFDRLMNKFLVGDDCWEWTSFKDEDGYGGVWLNGRTARAHRVMYELLVGPIPDGLQLDHLCRNKACVRPDHLEPVTLAENVRRAADTKTHCPQGHAYAGPNLYVYPNGSRACRICARAKTREWKLARRKEQGR